MSFLYICNTSSDYVSKVSLVRFKEEKKIPLILNKLNRIGPHDICSYKDKLLVANSYSNSLSIISQPEEREVENHFIGMHCNGVKVWEDNAYIICGELNSLFVFNLLKNKITEEIPCESFPHSISMDEKNNLMVISNMHSDSITLIHIDNREIVKNIKVAAYPTKAVFTPNGKYILVCESNMGMDNYGTLSIIDASTLNYLGKVKVGNSPVDIYAEDNYCYVSNFGEGSISIVDINNLQEKEKIIIGGMPRGILKYKKHLYVGDSYSNRLIKVDVERENKKAISIGGEPTGMTLC